MKTVAATLLLMILYPHAVLAAGPFLEGTVSDDYGRPIPGAVVKIWDCIGTCLGGVAVLTDSEGHYIFEEKKFRNFPSLSASMPGRYEVSRDQTGPALHEPDSDTPRRVDFVLGTPAAATFRIQGDVPEDWTQKVVIRAGRDARVHRYDEEASFVSGWGYWNVELLPRNEDLHLVVIREPVVVESDDPKETRRRQQENWRNRVEIISPAIRLTDPQRYDIRAVIHRDEVSEISYITIESVTDSLGTDRTGELTRAGSIFGPPVDAASQEQARALLKRVEAAAVPWNGRPAKSILSYEYDFLNSNDEMTHVTITQESPAGPAWSDISRLRGFAYMPPLRWLFSQPENVVFHGVEIGDDRATLHYRLKEPRGFSAGLGIGPGWNGFFSTGFSSGTLLIDTRTSTVLEHRLTKGLLGEESVETFGEYVRVDGGYAPKSMRIQSGNFDFRLSFKIHRDRLWLLDRATHGNDAQPVIRVDQVVVNLSE